jgi:hypothetical protein
MFDTTTTDLGNDDSKEYRRRSHIARLLMERGQEAIDPYQMESGYIIPVSALQGLDKAAAGIAGSYIDKRDRKRRQWERAQAGATDSLAQSGQNAAATQIAQAMLPPSYGLLPAPQNRSLLNTPPY